MYNNRCNEKIYPNIFSDKEIDQNVISSIVERCPKQEVDWGLNLKLNSIQDKWYQDYTVPEQYFDKNKYKDSERTYLKSKSSYLDSLKPGDEILAVDAVAWVQGSKSLDCRPKLFDKASNSWKLCDSGSMVTVVKRSEGDKIDKNKILQAVNGSEIKCYGQKEITIQMGRKSYKIMAIIADVDQDILGWDFIEKYRLDFVWGDFGDLYLRDRKADIKQALKYVTLPAGTIPQTAFIHDRNQPSIPVRNHKAEAFEVASMKMLKTVEPEQNADHIQPKYKRLIEKYPKILEPSFNDLSTKHGVSHRIDLKPGSKPCKAKLRPLMADSEKAIKGKQAWDQMIKLGVVEKVKANSPVPYSSPLHLVPKPDNTMRPCSDFRQLNSQTIEDTYPLPSLKSFTQKLKGSRVFSKVDLHSAFHNVIIDPRDVEKTATVTPWGVFVYKRLAFGLCNAPSTFSRLVDSVLSGIDGIYCYLDDCLVYAPDESSHFKILEKVFQRLQDSGLAIKLSKCSFGQKKVDYLGYEVSQAGIKPLKTKVKAIVDFPNPRSQKELLHFLGALGYFRTSLKGVKEGDKYRNPSEILQVLYGLATCKLPPKTKFQAIWDQDSRIQDSFDKAKEMLMNAALLTHPDPKAKLALCTDSSDFAIGGSLEQLGSDGKYHPLGYFSRHLGPDKQKWSTFRKELYACVQSLRYFLPDFYGRHITIFSDHLPLTKSFASNHLQSNDPVAQRQLVEIGMFTKDVQYVEAKSNHMADFLSRRTKEALIGEAYKLEKPEKGQNFVKEEVIDYNKLKVEAIEELKISSVPLQKIRNAQQKCPDIPIIKQGKHDIALCFETIDIDGVELFCEVSGTRPRPLLPEPLRLSVIKSHHCDHPGQAEAVRRTASQYFWPNMKKDIIKYVAKCHGCLSTKSNKLKEPHVGHFPVPQRRFSHIHVDVCGPLPPSRGYRYLLSVICRSTRFFDAIPIREASSEACADALLHSWISRHGLAACCTSDNGSEFVSKIWKQMESKLGIKLNYTPTYSPQSNGLVERQHSTLKTSLKAALVEMGEKYQDRWYDFLPWILLMKRCSYQKELNASPAMLTYGTNLSIPGDLLRDPGEPFNEDELKNLVDFMAKTNNMEAKQTTKPKQVEVEEPPETVTHVYTRQHNTTGLQAPYCGPFPIVSRPSRSQVKIKVGLTKGGLPRYELRSWRDLKVAPVDPDDVQEASRPNRGRKPASAKAQAEETFDTSGESEADFNPEVKINKAETPETNITSQQIKTNSNVGGKRSTRNPNPVYVASITGPPDKLGFPAKPVTWSASPADLEFINASIVSRNAG